MRSIGRRNINTVKELITDAKQQRLTGFREVLDYVYQYLDDKILDIWEGSYQEIETLVINELVRE